jgi:hypothetical protein
MARSRRDVVGHAPRTNGDAPSAVESDLEFVRF